MLEKPPNVPPRDRPTRTYDPIIDSTYDAYDSGTIFGTTDQTRQKSDFPIVVN